MKTELFSLLTLIIVILFWIKACAFFTNVTPTIKRKLTADQAIREMMDIIYNATEGNHMIQIPALLNEFKQDFKNNPDVDYCVSEINDAMQWRLKSFSQDRV